MKKQHQKTLYNIFDRLHPNMSNFEIEKVIYDLVDLKYKENDFEKYFKSIKVIIGDKEKGKKYLPYLDDYSFETAFQLADRIFIPQFLIDDTIKNDSIGKLIRTVGHELEHIYQYVNNIKDEYHYDFNFNYEIPNNIQQKILANTDEKTLDTINNYVKVMTSCHYLYSYTRSDMELKANIMGTLYYGFNLKQYALTCAKGDRQKWLLKQVDYIFEDQEITNDSLLRMYNLVTNLGEGYMKYGLILTTKYCDNDIDSKNLILRLFDIYDEFSIDEKFKEDFAVVFNNKFDKKLDNNNPLLYDMVTEMLSSAYDEYSNDKIIEDDTIKEAIEIVNKNLNDDITTNESC